MSTDAQKRATRKYAAANTVQKSLQFNKNTDADIIEYLEGVGNMSGLIKELLRERMAKERNPVTKEPKPVTPKKPDIKDKLKAKGITLL